jgi:hypothetical protein
MQLDTPLLVLLQQGGGGDSAVMLLQLQLPSLSNKCLPGEDVERISLRARGDALLRHQHGAVGVDLRPLPGPVRHGNRWDWHTRCPRHPKRSRCSKDNYSIRFKI